MSLLVSIAATTIDPEEFLWKRFKGSRKRTLKNKHQKHDLVLVPNDLYGVRQTRSRTPSFQILHQDKLHVLFRNISEKEMESLDKTSVDYRGKTPQLEELEEGRVRRKKVPVKPTDTLVSNKLKDSHYKPRRRIIETLVVDKENYQWRAMKTTAKPIRIRSKKQGKIIATLNKGDVIGVRFVSPSKGGYVILDSGERRNISLADYDLIEDSTRILPTRLQKVGLIDQKELKKVLKKERKDEKKGNKPKMEPIKIPIKPNEPEDEVEDTVKPLYDLDSIEDSELLNVNTKGKVAKRVKRHIRKHVNEIFDDEEDENLDQGWDEDADLDFDDEDEKGAVKKESADEVDDEEFEDGESEEVEENEDDDGLDKSALLADELVPGAIIEFSQAKSKKFTFIHTQPFERNDRLVEYYFSEVGGEEDEVYRIRLEDNYTLGDFVEAGAKIVGHAENSKLREMQNSLEYAEVRKMSFFK